MSLREDRFTGRIRRFFLFPTENMAADALTKKMLSVQLMDILQNGVLVVKVQKKMIYCRVRIKRSTYTEQDLEKIDG